VESWRDKGGLKLLIKLYMVQHGRSLGIQSNRYHLCEACLKGMKLTNTSEREREGERGREREMGTSSMTMTKCANAHACT
jgi:hypothetical protein